MCNPVNRIGLCLTRLDDILEIKAVRSNSLGLAFLRLVGVEVGRSEAHLRCRILHTFDFLGEAAVASEVQEIFLLWTLWSAAWLLRLRGEFALDLESSKGIGSQA